MAQIPRTIWGAVLLILRHERHFDAPPNSDIDLRPSLRFLNYPVLKSEEEKPIERLALQLRTAAFAIFDVIDNALLTVGLGAFIVSLSAWRAALRYACFVFAAACWALTASRIGAVAILNETLMPLLGTQYLLPAQFLLWSGSILSIVAAARLRARS